MMKLIIYTGAIADFYQACDFRLLLMKRGYSFSNIRTAGLKPEYKRPVIFIHIEAKEVWIGYASNDLHEFVNDDRYVITCSCEEIKEILHTE